MKVSLHVLAIANASHTHQPAAARISPVTNPDRFKPLCQSCRCSAETTAFTVAQIHPADPWIFPTVAQALSLLYSLRCILSTWRSYRLVPLPPAHVHPVKSIRRPPPQPRAPSPAALPPGAKLRRQPIQPLTSRPHPRNHCRLRALSAPARVRRPHRRDPPPRLHRPHLLGAPRPRLRRPPRPHPHPRPRPRSAWRQPHWPPLHRRWLRRLHVSRAA